MLCGTLTSAAQAQAPPPAKSGTIAGVQAEALREHLDEGEDLVDALLRWRHVVAWSDDGKLHAPPPQGPATTLISVEQERVRRLSALLDALAAQVPANAAGAKSARGDVRAHLEKAQEIAKELQPPVATAVDRTGGAPLLTVDRTSLERLNVELDAIEMLVPARPNELTDESDGRRHGSVTSSVAPG